MTQEQRLSPADVQALIEQELGVTTAWRMSAPVRVLGTDIEVLMPPDPRRLFFLITNLSVNDVHISPRPGVSAADGIFIPANGGQITSSYKEDFVLPTLEWSGLASGANSPIFILEVLLS